MKSVCFECDFDGENDSKKIIIHFFIYFGNIIYSAVNAANTNSIARSTCDTNQTVHCVDGTHARRCALYVPWMSKIVNCETATKRSERPYVVFNGTHSSVRNTLAGRPTEHETRTKTMEIMCAMQTYAGSDKYNYTHGWIEYCPRSGWTQRWSSCGLVAVAVKIGWQRTYSSPVARLLFAKKVLVTSFHCWHVRASSPFVTTTSQNTVYGARCERTSSIIIFCVVRQFWMQNMVKVENEKSLRSLIWSGRYVITNSWTSLRFGLSICVAHIKI